MIVNRYNFLRWSDGVVASGTDGDFSSEDFDSDDFVITTSEAPTGVEAEDVGELPRPYLWDRERCGYMPVLVAGEVMGFYINTSSGLDYATFSDLQMRFVNAATGAVAATGYGVIYQDMVSSTRYNIYSSFVIPSLSNGVYRTQIYRTSDSSVLLTSNALIARNDAQVNNQTLIAKFRNENYFYHVRYSQVGGFYQQFRLNISLLARQNETDKEVYKEVTTGKIRTFNNFLQRYMKFETYYFDPAAHEAAAIMVEHDFVELNGLRFRTKSPYKEPEDPRNKLGKGEFEMYDEAFGTVNRCSVNGVIVLGDGAGGYIGDGGGGVLGGG